MWDEEINKKIKDAADQYHPAYDDTAWNKMEQLLDEHLPRRKDRGRIIYFLPLLLLLLGGGIFFVISTKVPISPSKISEKPLSKTNQGKSQEVATDPNPLKLHKNLAKVVDVEDRLSKETSITAVNTSTGNEGKLSPRGSINIVNGNTQSNSKNLLPGDQSTQSEDGSPSTAANVKGSSIKNNSIDESINSPGKKSDEENVSPAVTGNDFQVSKVNNVIIKDDKEPVKPKDVAKVENSKKDENSNVRHKKTKKSFIQNFGIDLSAGPDVSAVKLSKAGKITLNYGAGLSYSFTKKFTLRTGFYVARKIYSVNDNEYHVPAGSTWNNFLQSVDANCKVYEIPLTISYSFGKTKNHNWFASAGLSSYLMKKESYVYYYKDFSGATWNKPWTVRNENKHYFSVLDISGGYEYSINKRFSISAEPYVKLPLSGIGLGKINLNSAGALFTVSVKPFLK